MKLNITIPNLLTMIRIALIPLFVLVFYLPWVWAHWATAALFVLAGFTDWLDGYLARRLGQFSKFGAFLDPVADKLIVSVALVLLVGEHASAWVAIPAAIIVCREIAISALREWMSEIGRRKEVVVGRIGKYKTAVQMFAIVLLLANHPVKLGFFWLVLAYVCLYLSVCLTLWSMVQYLRAAMSDRPWLTEKEHE
jgi:CDP-diacylglycerol--glycerol-3-phosphate 3-phosphatidyltransferase